MNTYVRISTDAALPEILQSELGIMTRITKDTL